MNANPDRAPQSVEDDDESRPPARFSASSLIPVSLAGIVLAAVASASVWVTVKALKIDQLEERLNQRDAEFREMSASLKTSIVDRIIGLQRLIDVALEQSMTKRDFDLWVMLNQKAYPTHPLLDRPK